MTKRSEPSHPSPPALFYWLVTVPLVLFGIDCGVAGMRGWSPLASRLDLVVVVGFALFVTALGTASAFPRLRAGLGRRWLGASAAWLGLVVALLLSELVLGLAGDRIERAPFHGHPRGLRQVLEAKLPGTSPVARFTVNSLGLRGTEMPEDPGVFRILCVGGSTTEDVFLDDEVTWTRRLADELSRPGGRRYWSASAGRSGFATVEHLRFLESGSVVGRFDAVVVLVGINDLARLVWGERADAVASRALGRPAPLWSQSRVFSLARRIWSALEPGNLVMDREALFVRAGQEKRSGSGLSERGLDVEPALEGFGKRLEAIVDAARRRGLTVVLADQPTLFRTSLSEEEERRLWFLRRSDGTYLPARQMRELMDEFNAVTASVAAAKGAHFVRLSDMDGDSEFFYDDCHFTEAGSAEVARRLATGVDWPALPLGSRRRQGL